MHPPFIFTDHKIGPDTVHTRPKMRRSAPARLDLRPMSPGWPPVPFLPHELAPPPPTGQRHLYVVPPPSNMLRDMIGRWLIRLGQRMILSGRPG